MKSKLPFVIVGIVLIIAIAAGAYFYWARKQSSSLVTKAGAPGAEPPHVLGPRNPRITIEEFADFQCPQCGKLHPVLTEIKDKYGASVAIIFRQFPLPQLHANALEAARAAEAAGLQGEVGFWAMHDFIFDTQDMWKDWRDVRSVFARQANLMGLDAARLRRDMDSPEVQQRIQADLQRAQSLRLPGAPAVFFNGRLLEPQETEKLKELVEATLGGSGSPSPR